MPNKNIRRGPSAGGAPADFTNRSTANDIYVDAVTGVLTLGTGTSGVVSKSIQTAADAPVTSTASAITLTQSANAGVPLVVNRAAGSTITLPAATGTGGKYLIIIGTALTSGSFIVQVANATDYMRGFAYQSGAAGASTTFSTANTGTLATESDTITLNRTTTGTAVIGDWFEIVDMATNIWSVEVCGNISSTAATPFSAAV